MDIIDTINQTKKIVIIQEPNKNKNDNATNKKINCVKEKKMRVETQTWGLNENELSHETQRSIITNMLVEINDTNTYVNRMIRHIKTKISGYKRQDILKKRINLQEFVSLQEVIDLLKQCELTCHYCSDQIFILYEQVRENKQWSLDRIHNDIGHNRGNLVVSCLECNLKRRTTNKDAFMFTKNMKIIKEGV
jgi:5-methylcytosine-specific restriction endonuclease McrA